MKLTRDIVLYGNEVMGLGHLAYISILSTAASVNYFDNVQHIVICKKRDFSTMAHIIKILSDNLCFIPLEETRYASTSKRFTHMMYSFEYFCRKNKINYPSNRIYGSSLNRCLEYMGYNYDKFYTHERNAHPLLADIFPSIFRHCDKVAIINARTTPCDTYSRNSDPLKLIPVIRLLKKRGYKVVRMGADFSRTQLDGIDLDLSNKWSSKLEIPCFLSASLVIGGLSGLTFFSGMLGIPTLLYDCPTPIHTYLGHNFPNHFLLFKKPPSSIISKYVGLYDCLSLLPHEYKMLGLKDASDTNIIIERESKTFLSQLISNTSTEICSAVNYIVDNLFDTMSANEPSINRFKSIIMDRIQLTSSHNILLPEYIYWN